MNLVLLVEGAQTEPRVYEAWLNRWLPGLQSFGVLLAALRAAGAAL